MQLALLQGSLKVTHSAGGQHLWQETTEAISLVGRAFPNFQVQDFTDLVNDWAPRFGKGGPLTVENIAEALTNFQDLAGDLPLKAIEEQVRDFHTRWGQPINLHMFTQGVQSLYHAYGSSTNLKDALDTLLQFHEGWKHLGFPAIRKELNRLQHGAKNNPDSLREIGMAITQLSHSMPGPQMSLSDLTEFILTFHGAFGKNYQKLSQLIGAITQSTTQLQPLAGDPFFNAHAITGLYHAYAASNPNLLKKNLANKIFWYLARCEFWVKFGLRFWILVGYVEIFIEIWREIGF